VCYGWGMTWSYTKTLAIIGLGGVVVRLVLTLTLDHAPFVGPTFWSGVTSLIFMFIIGVIMDLCSAGWHRWKSGGDRRAARY